MVLGASPNPARFSCKAVKSLLKNKKEVVAVGFREGTIVYEGEEFTSETNVLVGTPHIEDVETVSVYIGSSRQEPYYDYIISLKPRRVIFNPGTINPDFMSRLNREKIEPLAECMLVMLKQGEY